MKAFCGKCGEKLEKEIVEGFDEYTGERRFRMICPKRTCFHEGFPTHDTDKKRTFIERGGWFGTDYSNYACKRCGYTKREEYIPYYY